MKKANLLQKAKKIHFVGIGGVSMSSLAKLLKAKGYTISGSDAKDSNVTCELVSMDIDVYIGHSALNIKDVDIVVYSAAISFDNPELVLARNNNIICIDRAKLLGEIACQYSDVIAVAGMHGKTTTTAMLGQVFIDCGKNPTIHIGGDFDKIGGNLYIGGEQIFITEACEYKDSFLSLKPTTAVVTNIENEHLDYFKNFNNIARSFNRFCSNSANVFVQTDYKKHINSSVTTFGDVGDYCVQNKTNNKGKFSFDVYHKNKKLVHINLGVYGEHNVYNAIAAVVVADKYNLPMDKVAKSINNFVGVRRRFESVNLPSGCVIVKDYAHHPTEIKCAIDTAKLVYNKQIVVIFQPHTFSRTKTLFEDFIKCFSGVDNLVIIDTYSARENFDQKGSSGALIKALKDRKLCGRVFGSFNKTAAISFLKSFDCGDKVLLFLGAGDVVDIADEIKNSALL